MKATVKLILRKDYKTEEGKQQLSLRYIARAKSTHINIGISISPQNWDDKALQVKLREPFALRYNKVITEMYHRAMNIIMDNFGNPLSPKEFRKQLVVVSTSDNSCFYDFIDSELDIMKEDRSAGTISNYKKLFNTMKKWMPTLEFQDITLDFIQKFHVYEIKEGNLESTIFKNHANFKALINRAIQKDKIEENPYKDFAIRRNFKAQNNDILTEIEIAELHSLYDSGVFKSGMQEVLRTFLFSCYTSLSYADFHDVSYADLEHFNVDGHDCLLLSGVRTKTSVDYKILIVSKRVMELLRAGKDFQKYLIHPQTKTQIES